MRFNPNDYGDFTVMHCDTEEKAKVFVSFLHKCDKRWWPNTGYCYSDGTPNTKWSLLPERSGGICYRFNHGTWDLPMYFRKSMYSFEILEFDDFEWDEIQTFDADSVPSFEEIL